LLKKNFNSRFDCISKTYIYRITTAENPFERKFSWHVPYKLNLSAMKKAAKKLIGEHDFSAFCASGEQRENHIRKINYIKISKHKNIITIEINANSYLYNMVRIIMGTLVDITRGAISATMEDIIASKDRTKSGQTAPPCGLFLKQANY